MPRGPKPKPDGTRPERRVHQPVVAPGVGWQHGDIPPAPDGLGEDARNFWDGWFRSWWASYWTPEDLGGLLATIRLYDSMLRAGGKASDYVAHADRYGITPKGRQDLRWTEPKVEALAADGKVDDEVAKRREARAQLIS